MSGYENVGRLKTSSRLPVGRTRNKQRKWRVLLSIGLLLPALAAIIGIVAWTISVEVAHGNGFAPEAGSSAQDSRDRRQHHNNQHHNHHNQLKSVAYQQFRRQQAEQQASLVDSRGVKPVAAAVSGAAPRRRVLHAQQDVQEPTKQQQQQQETKVSERDSSALLLTNLDQALSGSSEEIQTTTTTTTTSPVESEEGPGEPAAINAEETRQPLETSSPRTGSANQSNNKPSHSQTDADLDVNSSPKEDAENDEPIHAAAKQMAEEMLVAPAAKNSRHKSRWLNDGQHQQLSEKKVRSKRPITSYELSSFPATNKEISMAKQLLANRGYEKQPETGEEPSGNKQEDGQQQQETDRSHNSKATANNGGRFTTGRTLSTAYKGKQRQRESRLIKQSDESGRPTAISGDQFGRSNNRYTLVDSKPDDDGVERASDKEQAHPETEAASGAASLGANKEEAENSSGDEEQQRRKLLRQRLDDELSFEAIASAISTSLSASQIQGDRPRSFLPEPVEGDTGVISALQPTAVDEAEQPSAQEYNKKQHQTTGEHVAQVIDHIVERRKQAGASSGVIQHGPQIVVVAPVGNNAASMKARSLTKAVEPSSGDSKTKKPVVEDKRISASIKKEALMMSQAEKKHRANKPLGARLLGVSPQQKSNETANKDGTRFSERVEVIEDDDSSAFLFKSPDSQVESEKLEAEDRSEDDSLGDKSMMASDLHDPSSIHVSSQPGEARHRSVRHEVPANMAFERYAQADQKSLTQQGSSQPKLYSAEQLIRDHVMKAKLRPKQTEEEIERSSSGPIQQPQQQSHSPNSVSQYHQQQQQPQQQHPEPQASQQVKIAPTTVRPHNLGPTTPAETSVNMNSQSQISQKHQRPAIVDTRQTGMQAVQVPLLHHSERPASAFNNRQRPAAAMDTYHQMESQTSYVHQQLPHHHQLSQQFASAESLNRPQPAQYYNQHAMISQETQNRPQHQQASSGLPVFADQEYNVPAHMAESVIQDIQRSQPTLGMFNGQPRLVSAGQQAAAAAVPPQSRYPHQMFYQQQPQSLMGSSSQQRSVYLAAQQQQLWNQMLASQQQSQVLANRESSAASEQTTPVKAPARGVIGHPVAQMALRHLLSSLGQQAAKQQAEADKAAVASRSNAGADLMQSSGSSPVGSQVMPPSASESGAAQRSMRSLPIGAAAPGSQQQLISDQEVQESYGQVPTYHMGGGAHHYQPHYGGGGGGHYPESEHDKKTKGITFHFGGGPIGGGTQLITSPMGIFKHLMIPLLPNPRVNLNGKVVFGVVLEKSTAFGEPKKKYKFWGR